MTLPGWAAAALAAAMLLVAAGSMVRLVIWRIRGRAAEPEADALHVVMGVAMAGMFEPRIQPVPDTAWIASSQRPQPGSRCERSAIAGTTRPTAGACGQAAGGARTRHRTASNARP
jgi:hypothetical protein